MTPFSILNSRIGGVASLARAAVVLWVVTWVPGSASAKCLGDCNGDGIIPIWELIGAFSRCTSPVLIFPPDCGCLTENGDQEVTVNDLVAAVNNALHGCPDEPTQTATKTPTAVFTATDTPPAPYTATPTCTITPSRTPTSCVGEPPAIGSVQATDDRFLWRIRGSSRVLLQARGHVTVRRDDWSHAIFQTTQVFEVDVPLQAPGTNLIEVCAVPWCTNKTCTEISIQCTAEACERTDG